MVFLFLHILLPVECQMTRYNETIRVSMKVELQTVYWKWLNYASISKQDIFKKNHYKAALRRDSEWGIEVHLITFTAVVLLFRTESFLYSLFFLDMKFASTTTSR